ncbi:MAG TPA: acyl-CoA dehydrogenase family protein, partial [Acetobacteraceae bacterium]|nr:acyl-CoA dehydrogenase family protein [Acetobacteraceae bacterium]
MDLTLSDKHRALQEAVCAFIRDHGHASPKLGGGRKRPDQKALDWQKLLVDHGYVARTIPREYGGFGAEPDVMEAAVIAAEFAAAGVYAGLTNQGISMLVPTLLEVGTDEQKKQWIEKTIRGDVIWCQGYSEPGAGSDLASLQTRGVLHDGHFVINGQKIWTSSAHYADMMFLLCRTEPDKPKHDGISYLLLSMRTPGIEVRPLRTMTGRAEFNEVFFTDVRVPETQIVLGRGKGWYVANVTLKHERSMIGDAGKLTQRLEQVIALMRSTEIDGTPLIAMAEFRDRLLRLQGEMLAWKAHSLRLLTEAAQGIDSGVKRMIIKYGGTMLGFRLASLAIDALGVTGLPFESAGEDAEDDDATTWNIDYMYDVGLMIGGGS